MEELKMGIFKIFFLYRLLGKVEWFYFKVINKMKDDMKEVIVWLGGGYKFFYKLK